MAWKIYKSSASLGFKAEISDRIFDVSGLEVKYNRNLTPVLPTCQLKVPLELLNIDDAILIYVDTKLAFLMYVTEIKDNNLKFYSVAKCEDYRMKLKNFRVGEIDSTWWSGYTPDDETEYKFISAPTSKWISVAFLFRILLAKALNKSVTTISDDFYSATTKFNFYNATGTYYFERRFDALAIQWFQLLRIGKSKNTDGVESTITCLDLYLHLCGLCHSVLYNRCDFHAYDDSGNYTFIFNENTYTPDIDDTISGYSVASIEQQYHRASVKRFEDINSQFNDYADDTTVFTEADLTEYKAEYTGDNKIVEFKLPNFLFISALTSSGLQLLEKYEDNENMVEQYSHEDDFNQAETFEIELGRKFNISRSFRSSKVNIANRKNTIKLLSEV